MMEASSLSPVIYDTTDTLFGLGLGGAFENWSIDMVIGFLELVGHGLGWRTGRITPNPI